MGHILCLALLGAVISSSQWAHAHEVPAFVPNVVDSAKILSDGERLLLNEKIESLQKSKNILAAIYLMNNLRGEKIESVAEQVFRAWKLGKAGRDNGILLIASIEDRRARIETGYGVEESLPDIMAYQLVESAMIPEFREGRYASGFWKALDELESRTPDQETHANAFHSHEKLDELNAERMIWGFLFNFVPVLIFWAFYLIGKIRGFDLSILRLPGGIFVAHGVSLLLGCFFSIFWGFAPLLFIIPFNSVFMLLNALIFAGPGILITVSRFRLVALNAEWDVYDTQKRDYLNSLDGERKAGSLTEFLKRTPMPKSPRRYFPENSSSNGSFGSSSGSSRSSSSWSTSSSGSSSSSSGGGRSGGGGASGGW